MHDAVVGRDEEYRTGDSLGVHPLRDEGVGRGQSRPRRFSGGVGRPVVIAGPASVREEGEGREGEYRRRSRGYRERVQITTTPQGPVPPVPLPPVIPYSIGISAGRR